MKHRWTAILLLAAALALGACRAPTEGGQESATPTMSPAETEAEAETENESEDASPTDSDGGIVDY